MMTDKKIIEMGYNKYEPTPIHTDNVEACFQKRVRDDRGTKYFIDIEKSKPWIHPHTGEEFPPSYEFTTQLCYKDNDCPLNLRMFAGCTVEQFEDFMEKVFNTGMFDYYEEH